MVHQCSFCSYTSARNNNLERHIQNKHTPKQSAVSEEKPAIFNCKFCTVIFTIKTNCTRHENDTCPYRHKQIQDIESFDEKISTTFDCLSILDKYRTNVTKVLSEYINTVYSEPLKQNVHITNIKSTTCYVYRNNNWEVQDKSITLEVLVKQLLLLWRKDYKSITNTTKEVKNILEHWKTSYNNMKLGDTKDFKTIKKTLQLKLYNNSKTLFPSGRFIPPLESPKEFQEISIVKPSIVNPEPHVFDNSFGFT